MTSVPTRFDVVALAASAGGLSALGLVLSGLPGNFPATVVVVQHLAVCGKVLLPGLLAQRTPLPVRQARDGERLEGGVVYVAPSDYHLLTNGDATLSLSHAAVVNFVRPAADRLFETLAESFQERALAVVLTGTGSDGARGVQAIHNRGGTVLVQNPGTAAFSGMPAAAIQTGHWDYILEIEEIAPTVKRLVCPGDDS